MPATVTEPNRRGLVGRFFANLGPGLVTGAADDDPSGISTYSVAGAVFGYSFLWTALLSFPLMAAVQLMCARLGMVTGIARIGDMRKLGRVGLKALLYFEVVTSIALLVGFVVVKVVQPGAGINATAATLDAKAVQQYATPGKQMTAVEFLLHIIPDT